MIYLCLPVGSNFGWGILGREIAFALSRQTEICLLAPPERPQPITDEFDSWQVRRLMASPDVLAKLTRTNWVPDGPIIQMADGANFARFVPQLAPPSTVGFAVFVENALSPADVQHAREHYRYLAAGSTYCAEVLRQHGIGNVSTVYHGVDSTLFCPREEPRTFLQDKFVIFSGGKFELRKGQDIVLRAYKVLQDRHPDVFLVNAWYTMWPSSRDTMAQSRLIRYFPPPENRYFTWMNDLLAANGLDVNRVIITGLRDNRLLPRLYHSSDLGFFPNRVEGGTNMVLMEYLACGKPALVSYNSGHKDVVRPENAVLIRRHGSIAVQSENGVVCTWSEPDIEECIEKLEWCYQNRDKLSKLGRQAATDMREFTWREWPRG